MKQVVEQRNRFWRQAELGLNISFIINQLSDLGGKCLKLSSLLSWEVASSNSSLLREVGSIEDIYIYTKLTNRIKKIIYNKSSNLTPKCNLLAPSLTWLSLPQSEDTHTSTILATE